MRCTFFGERKNWCSSKIVQLLSLNIVKSRWSKNRAAQGFHYTNSLISNFLDPIQKRAPARSLKLEAVYFEALLYLSLIKLLFDAEVDETILNVIYPSHSVLWFRIFDFSKNSWPLCQPHCIRRCCYCFVFRQEYIDSALSMSFFFHFWSYELQLCWKNLRTMIVALDFKVKSIWLPSRK